MVIDPPRLTVLDVGHGNSAILEDTTGVVVVDAGRGSSVLEYLRDQDIRRVDLVLISHADQDHLGGLLAILGTKDIELVKVRVNTDSSKSSAVWDDVLYELSLRKEAGEIDFEPVLTSEDSIYVSGAIHLDVLAPSSYLAGKGPGSKDRQGRRITTNSISAVIRVVREGEPIALLPGDLDEVGLANVVEAGKPLDATILVFPHHGGKAGGDDLSAFAADLVKRVSPKLVIFSIGRTRFRNPQPDVVDEIRKAHSNIWIACTQLSQRCAEEIPSTEPAHLSGAFSQGRAGKKCCAGSFVIALDARRPQMLPVLGEHQDFVSGNAPSALCRGRNTSSAS